MQMVIEPNMDSVIINGQTVRRPPRMARSVWLAFWASVVKLPGVYPIW